MSVSQPKLLEYCTALYDKFLSEADEHSLWRGRLVKTATEVGIPDGVYKRVTDQLIRLECIEQIERGVRGQPTTILLHRRPSAEVWAEADAGRDRLTRRDESAILSRRVDDLERRLDGVNIKEALVSLQQQISVLQKQNK